ncbi:MAG: hypothetical protein O2971_17995 [Proteobacteria bacterium]|nr:hypothetical protein [Pseudomonadota bacterium]
MKIKSLLLAFSISLLAACSATSQQFTTVDSELVEFRYFLTGLTHQMQPVGASGIEEARRNDIMQIRDEMLIVIGTARSLEEFSDQQYFDLVSLAQQLYRKMCAEQRFVPDRSALYARLLTPGIDSRLARL